MKGVFISFEGPDGSGKTTQLKKAAAALRKQGYDVLESREPGGTVLAEKVRSIVLDPDLPINNITEVLLYLAARSEHVEKVLAPAVAAGKIVLCDRFSDSTLVYQGLTRGLKLEELTQLRQLNAFASNGLVPDMTLLLDGRPEVLLGRRDARGVSDRYENKGLDFQHAIRNGFVALAQAEPERVKIVNAEGDEDQVEALVLQEINCLLEKVKA